MYTPGNVPSQPTPEALAQYIADEFARLAGLLQEIKELQFAPLNTAPSKPREGMLAYADGVNWNPGGTGAGLYRYTASAWAKL